MLLTLVYKSLVTSLLLLLMAENSPTFLSLTLCSILSLLPSLTFREKFFILSLYHRVVCANLEPLQHSWRISVNVDYTATIRPKLFATYWRICQMHSWTLPLVLCSTSAGDNGLANPFLGQTHPCARHLSLAIHTPGYLGSQEEIFQLGLGANYDSFPR